MHVECGETPQPSQSPPDLFRHVALKCGATDGFPTLVWGPWGGPLMHYHNIKRQISVEAELRNRVGQLESELLDAEILVREKVGHAYCRLQGGNGARQFCG